MSAYRPEFEAALRLFARVSEAIKAKGNSTPLAKTMTMSYTPAMSTRTAKPVTVTLGPLTGMAQGYVASGRYASVSEVVRAGLRALEREEAALDAVLKAKVEAALADPSPSIAHADVFAQLGSAHEQRKTA